MDLFEKALEDFNKNGIPEEPANIGIVGIAKVGIDRGDLTDDDLREWIKEQQAKQSLKEGCRRVAEEKRLEELWDLAEARKTDREDWMRERQEVETGPQIDPEAYEHLRSIADDRKSRRTRPLPGVIDPYTAMRIGNISA